MKIQFLLLPLLFAFSNEVRAEAWQFQESGTLKNLRGVHFLTTSLGFAVGDSGTILKTSNGGTSWVKVANAITEDLTSVTFINADTGFATGLNGTILRTTNGGSTWAFTTSNSPRAIRRAFLFHQKGYAVGDSGLILKTTNGGSSWTPQTSGTDYNLRSVFFVNDSVGYVVGGTTYSTGLVMKTTNGGAVWFSQATTQYPLYDIQFTSPDTGYVSGMFTNYYPAYPLKTTIAGLTWRVPLGSPAVSGYALQFIGDTGYMVGSYGAIRKSSDGGFNWKPYNFNTNEEFLALHFPAKDTGYIVGSHGVILRLNKSAPDVAIRRFDLGSQSGKGISYRFLTPLSIEYRQSIAGRVHLRVLSLNGKVLWARSHQNQEAGVHRLDLPAESVVGGHILEIVAGKQQQSVLLNP